MRDTHNNIKVVKTVSAQTASGTTDITGADVDVRGFRSVEHIVSLGNSGDTLSGSVKIELVLQHADADSVGSAAAYENVASNDYVLGGPVDSNGIFAVVDAGSKDDAVFRIGYRGPKRFSRVKLDLTGTHTVGTQVAAVALLGHAGLKPVSDS